MLLRVQFFCGGELGFVVLFGVWLTWLGLKQLEGGTALPPKSKPNQPTKKLQTASTKNVIKTKPSKSHKVHKNQKQAIKNQPATNKPPNFTCAKNY